MKTVVCKLVGPLLVVINGPNQISDKDWDEALLLFKEWSGQYKAILIWTLGAMPNATQRRRAATGWDSWKTEPPKVAIMAGPIARGVVTAINWMTGKNNLKAFAPTEVEESLAYLNVGVPASQLTYVLAKMRQMVDASAA